MIMSINLNWSDKPIYERIVAGGPKGHVVKTQTQVALFNIKEKDFLIYAERGGEAIKFEVVRRRRLSDPGKSASGFFIPLALTESFSASYTWRG